ncbi:MAG: ribosome-binding factor A [Acidobacteria bacterium RBG_16_68_9]|nr:MAG: ribosome-binding factor A [Acidobacteria bacterium RBG_16_68_9]
MTRRVERVADAIHQVIAELLLREIKDPRIGMVTLTEVRLSADLRHARVLFSMIGDEAQRTQSLAGLRSACGFIRTQIAHRLRLRSAPDVSFEFDPSLERADRVTQLLKAVQKAPTDDERDPDS